MSNKVEVEYKIEDRDGVQCFIVDGFSYPLKEMTDNFGDFINKQVGYMLVGLAKGEFAEGCNNLFHAGFLWHIYKKAVDKLVYSKDEKAEVDDGKDTDKQD